MLDERAPFVTGPQLEAGEDELFLLPEDSGTAGSVYEHCCRAIDRSLTRRRARHSAHGQRRLERRHESRRPRGQRRERLARLFSLRDPERFIPLGEARGDGARAARYRASRRSSARRSTTRGWDGGWYRRAFYDDGTPLGTAPSDECRIDAIAQAWSVLSGAAPAIAPSIALDAMEQHLVVGAGELIRLLTPAVRQDAARSRLHQGISARRARERRAVHARRAVGRARAGASWAAPSARRELLEMLSPITHGAHAGRGGASIASSRT